MSSDPHHETGVPRPLRLGALIGVLGVVYGDIGTSPLYSLQTCLSFFSQRAFTSAEVLGMISLITWTLFLTVTLKYVTLIMRADNNGEGGTLSLMALASRVSHGEHTRTIVGLIGIVGAGLFFGDGVITPAISILSAVEGIEVVSPATSHLILPIALAVIAGLFLVQRHGTGRVGIAFGPVMALWFLAIGGLGLVQILHYPAILAALSPSFAGAFMVRHHTLAFVTLGAVVLAVTGAEALYADMSHFGKKPIRITWLFFVLPCLLLNYYGQGALVISNPGAADNPFYKLAPHALQVPLILLATMATVIASQSVVSGAFSVARMSIQLGLLPRMEVRHTSAMERGQIYVPQINAILAIGVILLVLGFGSSAALASAYGIAVTGTFVCDNTLAAFVFRRQFGWSRLAVIAVFGAIGVVDVAFFAANSMKIFEGGWVPLVIGLSIILIMTTWRRGRGLIMARWIQDSLPLKSFLARLPQSRIVRVPGTAVFLTGNPDFVPNALLHNLKHNKVLHEQVFFVTVRALDIPYVGEKERVKAEQAAPGIYKVTIQYGFMESPNVPQALESLTAQGIDFKPMQASYFVGRETVVPASVPKLRFIRRWLFLFMARNAISATEFFRIPADRVVELGVRIAV
jgi:KUP system potassium uptake protein